MTKISLIFRCIFFLFTVSFIVSSCEKDETTNQSDVADISENTELSISEKNELIEEYAYTLAMSMVDNELRSTIKLESKLMFDGDYNILANKFELLPLGNQGIQVKDLLITSNTNKTKSLKSGNSNGTKITGTEFLEKIKKAFPNLQVSVPIHCDDWDTENYIPLVAFLPFDYDEHTAKEIVAYDYQGKKYKLSLDIEPSEPVIVVSRSERVDENGNMIGKEDEYISVLPTNNSVGSGPSLKSAPSGPSSLTLSHGPAQSIILQWADVDNETSYEVWRMHQPSETQFWHFATTGQNDNGYVNSWIAVGAKVWYKVRAKNSDGYSSWSPVMATTVSARNDNEWLKVKRMKFSSSALKAVEKWASGAPEIRLRVVQGSTEGASTVFTSGRMEPNRRKDIEGTWWDKEVPIFTWSTSTYGTVLTFDWREEDWDDNVEFTISASFEDKAAGGTIKPGGSVKFTGDDGGDHIGNTSVMWWHNRDQIYNLSGFEWQFVY